MTASGDTRRTLIVAFIGQYTAQHGYAPTGTEIRQALGISSTSILSWHLDRLERDGTLTRYRETGPRRYASARSITLSGEAYRTSVRQIAKKALANIESKGGGA